MERPEYTSNSEHERNVACPDAAMKLAHALPLRQMRRKLWRYRHFPSGKPGKPLQLEDAV